MVIGDFEENWGQMENFVINTFTVKGIVMNYSPERHGDYLPENDIGVVHVSIGIWCVMWHVYKSYCSKLMTILWDTGATCHKDFHYISFCSIFAFPSLFPFLEMGLLMR